MIDVRPLRHEDVPGADRLRKQVRFNQSVADWHRLITWEPEGCFVAIDGKRIVGTVTSTAYGHRLAWIGMVIVDHTMRRRGIGRRLLSEVLDYLEVERGVAAVGLDATPSGRPLYADFGFTDQCELWRHQGVAVDVSFAAVGARRMRSADLPAVIQLDSAAFGVDRSRVLADLYAAYPSGWVVVERGTAVVAYACCRPGASRWHVGPLVAPDRATAAGALRAVLAPIRGQPVELDAVDGHPGGELAARYGLKPHRPFTRMIRGEATTGRPDMGYAIVGPELG